MQNDMEQEMKNDMETGSMRWFIGAKGFKVLLGWGSFRLRVCKLKGLGSFSIEGPKL